MKEREEADLLLRFRSMANRERLEQSLGWALSEIDTKEVKNEELLTLLGEHHSTLVSRGRAGDSCPLCANSSLYRPPIGEEAPHESMLTQVVRENKKLSDELDAGAKANSMLAGDLTAAVKEIEAMRAQAKNHGIVLWQEDDQSESSRSELVGGPGFSVQSIDPKYVVFGASTKASDGIGIGIGMGIQADKTKAR